MYLFIQITLATIDTHAWVHHQRSPLETLTKSTQMQFECALVALMAIHAVLAEHPFTNGFIIHSVLYYLIRRFIHECPVRVWVHTEITHE